MISRYSESVLRRQLKSVTGVLGNLFRTKISRSSVDESASPSRVISRSQKPGYSNLTPVRATTVSLCPVSPRSSSLVHIPSFLIPVKSPMSATMNSPSDFHLSYLQIASGRVSHLVAFPGPDRDGGSRYVLQPIIPHGSVVMPGSFNPLHAGHEALAQRAARESPGATGRYFFEISIENVDKGTVPVDDMLRRVDYITSRGHSVILSNFTLFDEKSEVYKGCIFVVGYDTYNRVLNPRYYTHRSGGLLGVLDQIKRNGCSFHVGGRLDRTSGIFYQLDASETSQGKIECVDFECKIQRKIFCISDSVCLETPPLGEVFKGAKNFRLDMSSTEIRNGDKTKTILLGL